MKKMIRCLIGLAAVAGAAGGFAADGVWISVPNAPVFKGKVTGKSRAAEGTSWFTRSFTNSEEISSAKWTVCGLGVFEVYVNGQRVGDDFLKPGFTHFEKTKYSFSYDVTDLLNKSKGAENILAGEVSAGWWRDKIVTPNGWDGFAGKKSAFIGTLKLVYKDGRSETIGTDTESWRCGVAGSVIQASIFDGETYDARKKNPVLGGGLNLLPERNEEFKGVILPSNGGEVLLRRDLAMVRGPYSLKKGETIVVDFDQNCAAVPEFVFSARRGTVLTALPGEMLNDAEKGKRGSDGP
jgi:alpha-L-rhamnosidase